MEYIPRYIAVANGKGDPEYLFPELEPILKETNGVTVYQEQVMKIATDLAGFSKADSDGYRKALGKKIKAKILEMNSWLIDGHHDEKKGIHIDGMVFRGFDRDKCVSLTKQLEEFAKYAFNKAHAAAYSKIVMQTAYMKAHYYIEYMAPLISSYIGKSDSKDRVAAYIEEVKANGHKILPPDVNMSEFEYSIEGNDLRFAMAAIAGMFKSAYIIIEERNANGKFIDLYDLLERVPLNKLAVDSLVYSGALDNLALETNFKLSHENNVYMKTKRKLTVTNFETQELIKYEAKIAKGTEGELVEISREKISFNIFEVASNREMLLQYIYYIKDFGTLVPNTDILDMVDVKAKFKPENLAKYLKLMTEKLYLDMYISDHPLREISPPTNWEDDGQKETIVIIRNVKNIKTSKGDDMAFIQVEALEGIYELLLFPRQYESLIGKFEKNGIRKLTIESKWSPDRGYSHIINSVRYYKDV